MEGQPKIYIRILNWEKKYWKKSSKDQNCQILSLNSGKNATFFEYIQASGNIVSLP